MNGVVILWKTKTIEMTDKDSTLFFPLSLPFSQLHLLFLMEFHTNLFHGWKSLSSGTMQQLWQSQHGTIWRYVKLRLAFSGDGVCVVFEVVRARPIQWKLENRSCKQSHKLDGIRVERIRIV